MQPSQHELKRILTPEMYDKYDRLLLQVGCIGVIVAHTAYRAISPF